MKTQDREIRMLNKIIKLQDEVIKGYQTTIVPALKRELEREQQEYQAWRQQHSDWLVNQAYNDLKGES